MLFNLWQPKPEARRPRQTAGLRVEELPRRLMLSGTGNADPLPVDPPPPPPPPPPADAYPTDPVGTG